MTAETPKPHALAPGATVGFATALLMWSFGYLLRVPGVEAPPAVTGALLLVVQAVGSFVAGRVAAALPALVGAIAGATTGLLNLLVLGSLLAIPASEGGGVHPQTPIAVAGWLLFSIVVGMVGALVGARTRRTPAPAIDFLGAFAAVAWLAVVPLLVIGGAVTSRDAGLAVPDWPRSYGYNMFLYPLSRMTGAIYLEHAHRLFGALVGLTTLALVVFTFARDRRIVARALVLISFLAVAAQGVVGGLRVTETSPLLALLHGVAAQLIFALLGVCAVVLSSTWKRGPAPVERPGAVGLRTLAVVAFVALIIQIGLGGAIRHFNRDTLPMHAVISHGAWSVVVLVLLVACGVKSRRAFGDLRPIRVCGTGLLHGVSGQFLLGWIALAVALAYPVRDEAPAVRAVIATAHQTIGALLLAFSATLYAWSRRLLLPLPPGERAATRRVAG